MSHFSTSAIILTRRNYSDFDLIITALSEDLGKVTLMAKNAKKSIKRFSGGLEPFSQYRMLFRQGRGKGMYLLEESETEFIPETIRSSIKKTAYASYWAELIALWFESGHVQPDVFQLLKQALSDLNSDSKPDALISLVFLLRFIGIEGFLPMLEQCSACRTDIDTILGSTLCFDLKQGGIICQSCPTDNNSSVLHISKGTVKQLSWLLHQNNQVAERVRFSTQSLSEATTFLNSFVPYHIGKMPKSLRFLVQICQDH